MLKIFTRQCHELILKNTFMIDHEFKFKIKRFLFKLNNALILSIFHLSVNHLHVF